MARKAIPTSPRVLALIENTRVNTASAALPVRERGDIARSPQGRHRNVKLRARHHARDQ